MKLIATVIHMLDHYGKRCCGGEKPTFEILESVDGFVVHVSTTQERLVTCTMCAKINVEGFLESGLPPL
jgi:hypothetical protein